MSPTMMVVGGVVLAFVIFIFIVIGIYNKLVRNRNEYQNAFSQIDVQLTRRYELIPNLVETAKKFMKHEQETLTAVIEARNQAHKININMGKDPANPQMMEKLVAAEGTLGKAMGSFFALAEKYPDLKSDSTMNNLMEELTSTENKVAFARQHYNDTVTDYNVSREEFPSNIIAGMFNFSRATLFEVEDPKAKGPVKVSFD
jgi:LemA protein